MDNSKVQEIIEKEVLTVAKVVKDKIDDEIHALDRLDLDDIDVFKEHRLQQMKKMSEKQSRWIAQKLWRVLRDPCRKGLLLRGQSHRLRRLPFL
ncbi:hypothetical protein ACSBR2_038471 [Camellia fascicularis]